MRAHYKRWVADIGQTDSKKLEYARMGQKYVQTYYLGKRPNCFRVYDKLAEYHCQYARFMRKLSDAAEPPSFEELYGYPANGITLSRVERQIGGGRVPAELQTFGCLRASA